MTARATIASVLSASCMVFVSSCHRQDSSAELKSEIESAKKEIRESHEALKLEIKQQDALMKAQAKQAAEQLAVGKPEALSKKVDKLQDRLAEVESRVRRLAFSDAITRSVELRPSVQGFSTILTDFGALTFQIKDVTPFADSTKLLLIVGNTVSATMTGVTASLEYGPLDEEGIPVDGKTKQMTDVALGDLVGGSFNRVSIPLQTIPPQDFGWIRVYKVEVKGLRM